MPMLNKENSMVYISPSILNCDFSRLAEECVSLEKCGADWIHCDVMDGKFVPNISFGAPIVKAVDGCVSIPLDVHLMIDEPIRYIDDFVKAGADIITFHIEATENVQQTIECIKSHGIKVGISVKPNTPVSVIEPYAKDVDLVLIMSVEPGFGGQSFMPQAVAKVADARRLCPNAIVEVDGGINESNVGLVLAAGANAIVAGSSVIGAVDRKAVIKKLRQV